MKLVDVVALSKIKCKQPICAKIKYTSNKNFVGRPIDGYTSGLYDLCLLEEKTAEQLCKVQNFLNDQYDYGLLIYDAYRPKRAVRDFLFWSKRPPANEYEIARKAKYYPNINKCDLFKLDYISEDSEHCYGNVVDLVLFDIKQNKKLDMGGKFDCMDVTSNFDASIELIGDEGFHNRKILRESMEKFDFTSGIEEFWHFSYAKSKFPTPQDIAITNKLRNLNVKM